MHLSCPYMARHSGSTTTVDPMYRGTCKRALLVD
jgi:hypothetical protein